MQSYRSPILLGLAAVALLGFGLFQDPGPAPSTAPAADGYRILVVNDDGIDTPGIAALVLSLSSLGEVVVAAPDGNRSGASQSSHIFSEIMVATPREMEGATEAWALSGTPADCTAYGVIELGGERGFDLVVSGINRGSNVGEVAHYSGTVGAAIEGGMRGIPSIAISEDSRIEDHSVSAEFTTRFAAKLLAEGGTPGVIHSINVPSAKPKGVKIAAMGGLYLTIGSFQRKDAEDGSHKAKANIQWNREAPAGSDTAAYLEGFISVAPLRVDWTDQATLDRIESWGLGLPE